MCVFTLRINDDLQFVFAQHGKEHFSGSKADLGILILANLLVIKRDDEAILSLTFLMMSNLG